MSDAEQGRYDEHLDERQTEQAMGDQMRQHLSTLHSWEQDWIDQHTDLDLIDQHREAHDMQETHEGHGFLYEIAHPHGRTDLQVPTTEEARSTCRCKP